MYRTAKRRKNTIILIDLVLCMVMMCMYLLLQDRSGPTEILACDMNVDMESLVREPYVVDYAVDPDDKRETTKAADAVFAARVLSCDKTIYRGSLEAGGKVQKFDIPLTQYTVEVVGSLKGDLEKSQRISILKEGGIKQDKKTLVLEEKDQLLEENRYYIILAHEQGNGSLLVSGYYASVLLDAQNQQEVLDCKQYQEYQQAASGILRRNW